MTRTGAKYDAIIIGAGAAGLMAAGRAAARGAHVLVIDHNSEPGKKILISGGGRCNFTNVQAGFGVHPPRYLSANPHFAKSALGRFEPQDFIAMVDSAGIAWHEKTLGQLFCDGSARQIVALLMEQCAGVAFRFGAPVDEVRHDGADFAVRVAGETLFASRLVLACGGPSIPKLGASDFAYRSARQFDLKIIEPRPALVPLTLGGDDLLFRELSGVSTEVVATAGEGKAKGVFREAALLTHRGLSGPAILQISSYWRKGEAISLDFLPDDAAAAWLLASKAAQPNGSLAKLLADKLPQRLAQALAEKLGAADKPLHALTDKALDQMGQRLNRWRFTPNGSEGYAKAEVTIGGIATDGLNQKTLEAKHLPGLHVIGEAVDVTGWLGGYNFQWAWASGAAVGDVI
ncbi:aminoacetone oxidase family FAD-binding enzyme [Pseudonocardia sp. TMWB2A]|uniref:NAD(P)/FAD-dependent oxidoreductase n=1 Tax=Pseudonocardia sp. TMWB2A TaxID=687430 RepID=UPI00307D7680